MDILGIDNVIFTVGDLNRAAAFYERIGFPVRFRLDALDICILSVGFELPGLILKKAEVTESRLNPERARFWVEVPDTQKTLKELTKKGIDLLREPLQLPTGLLVEVADPWGNVVGFTDHLSMPEMGRKKAGKNTGRSRNKKRTRK